MTREVFDSVLPFSIRIVRRRLQDPSSPSLGVVMMTVNVLNPNHHRMPIIASLVWTVTFAWALFRDGNRSLANVELGPMVSNPPTQSESERVAEPFNGLPNIRIT